MLTNLTAAVAEKFSRKRILVVGDLVADQFLLGTIARVSREAPVFILRHDETETRAGGAANAAVNVAALGGQTVLVGAVGADPNGAALMEKLRAANVDCDSVVVSGEIKTTTKIRVLAGQQYAPRQQVIRIDYENPTPIDAAMRNELEKNLSLAAANADAIVVSDYNYGVARDSTARLAARICTERNIPLLVDSRFNLKNFAGATTATPNQDEVEQILGADFTPEDCAELRRRLDFEALLVTRGNKGMLLVEKDKAPQQITAVGALEPLDVTGAGDTVIAAYALGLAAGLSFAEAANLANHAGGIVVMKKGTASVEPEELLASLRAQDKSAEHKTQAI